MVSRSLVRRAPDAVHERIRRGDGSVNDAIGVDEALRRCASESTHVANRLMHRQRRHAAQPLVLLFEMERVHLER